MTGSRLPDPAASRAVLVGVSQYTEMQANRQLPAVENNLQGLASLMCDPRIWGLATEHCVVLHQPESADAVITALRTAAQEATAALLFYYAGHGLIDPLIDEELYLALPGSREPAGTHLALAYRHVRAELQRAAVVPQKAVLLDCCWSGKVLKGGTTMGADDLAAIAAVNGTAVLTACASTAKALSPVGEPYTAFTGALAQTLDQGLPEGPREFDVSTLHQILQHRLGGQNRPLPQFGTSGSGSGIVLGRNVAWRDKKRPAGLHTAPAQLAPAVTELPPTVGGTKRLLQDLLRSGRYKEAYELRLCLAEAGYTDVTRDLVAQLRREGSYRSAAELERAAAGSEAAQHLLRQLRQGSPGDA
ncbi:caspase family protein [Streptomyces sp. or3]|uniref:caspase family protein n=1 Tax=Streptomyces sp. or3 TaxID=1828020 RepID=UPI000BFE515B|nr:caspase family protein [Streptomyces sp. or3]